MRTLFQHLRLDLRLGFLQLFLSFVAALPGCFGAEVDFRTELHHFSGATMGTSYSVRVVENAPVSTARLELKLLQAKVDQRLGEINRLMSTYDTESELSRFNQHQGKGWFSVSRETAHVVEFALKVASETGGAFDPTVGPVVNLWGFGPDKNQELPPTEANLAAARLLIGYTKLAVRADPPALRKSHPGLYVDLSAIAKGFAVDEISKLLSKLGFVSSMVEIGGEVRTQGSKPGNSPWRIGVEKPDAKGRSLLEVFRLHDAALATSGDYRNFFEHKGIRYSHTIDPTTARPVQHQLATVSVLAETCLEADALATALLVLGDRDGYAWCLEHGVAALFLIRNDHKVVRRATPQFEKMIAKNKQHQERKP